MLKKILNILKNEKGESNILGFIVIAPIITYFIIYIVLGGDFYLDTNNLSIIVNKKLDQAIIVGQFTTTLKQELIDELKDKGFIESSTEISITPTIAGDNDNNTYVTRGNEIEITVLYKKAHGFYYINFGSGGQEKYYIGTKIQGMSEKW